MLGLCDIKSFKFFIENSFLPVKPLGQLNVFVI
nr:MAG TPA: hypothetical protein [Caudoviricetes sp.]